MNETQTLAQQQTLILETIPRQGNSRILAAQFPPRVRKVKKGS